MAFSVPENMRAHARRFILPDPDALCWLHKKHKNNAFATPGLDRIAVVRRRNTRDHWKEGDRCLPAILKKSRARGSSSVCDLQSSRGVVPAAVNLRGSSCCSMQPILKKSRAMRLAARSTSCGFGSVQFDAENIVRDQRALWGETSSRTSNVMSE